MSVLNVFFRNPEFVRLLRSKLRLKSAFLLAVLAVLIFGVILLGMYYDLTNGYGRTTAEQMLRHYFFTVTGIQLGIVTFFGLSQAVQVITVEREKRTYDFQRLVAMGPGRVALGKLLGGPCQAWWLALCALPFACVPVMGQAITAGAFVESQLIIFVFGLTVSAGGLLFSSLFEKTSQASGVLVLFILVMFSGSGLLMALSFASAGSATLDLAATASPVTMLARLSETSTPGSLRASTVSFLGCSVPAIWGFLFLHLLSLAFVYPIIVRRILDPELSFLAPRHAVLAFAVFQAVILLGCWDLFHLDPHAGLVAFHAANALALVLLPFGLFPSGDLLRGRLFRGAKNEHWRIFFEKTGVLQDSPPMRLVCGLAAAYVLEAAVLTIYLDVGYRAVGWLAALAVTVMIACTSIAMASVLLSLLLYIERRGLGAGLFALALALSLPQCVVALLAYTWDYSILVSPIAYLAELRQLLRGNPLTEDLQKTLSCPLICVVLAVACSVLAVLRIRFLLDMRELERRREAEANSEQKPA